MDFDDVEIKLCLQEITKVDLQLNAIIQDVRNCEDSLSLEEYNREVRDKILTLKDQLDDFERLANEQDKETDKIALLREVTNCRTQLNNSQQSLRKANLAGKLSIEKRERQSLTGGNAAANKKKSTRAELAKTSSKVTEDLMSLSRSLASQVQAGETSLNTLVTSSSEIGETNEEFKVMSGHIQNSRKLLTKYGRREVTDKLLIVLALIFFFATVVYILKKRMFSSSNIVDTAESLVGSQTSGHYGQDGHYEGQDEL